MRSFVPLAFLFATPAHAIPFSVDKFDCTLSVTDARGKALASSRATFEAARRPNDRALPDTAPQGAQATSGEFSLQVERPGMFRARFIWNYSHAVAGSQGFNTGCETVEYCDLTSRQESCMGLLCALSFTPDSPFSGWTEVPLKNGVPEMAPQYARLSHDWSPAPNREFRLRCNHQENFMVP